MQTKVNKALLTYIGMSHDKPERKNKQFTLEITGEELNRIKTFPYPQTFTGKIVAKGEKSKWQIDDTSHNFCNPFYDFHHYHYAGWKIQVCVCEGTFHHDFCPFRVK